MSEHQDGATLRMPLPLTAADAFWHAATGTPYEPTYVPVRVNRDVPLNAVMGIIPDAPRGGSPAGWYGGYYFDPRLFEAPWPEDPRSPKPSPFFPRWDDAYQATQPRFLQELGRTPLRSRDSDPCLESVDDFLIGYIESDPKTWAPQNPHYVKNHVSAPGTVRQWFRAMRAADFERATDRSIVAARVANWHPEAIPWTLFDTQQVVDRETADHYWKIPDDYVTWGGLKIPREDAEAAGRRLTTIAFVQGGRVVGRIINVAVPEASGAWDVAANGLLRGDPASPGAGRGPSSQ